MMAGRKINWDLYTEVEDLAINLEKFYSKIGEPDPVTGCQHQTHGGRHRQGYLMQNVFDVNLLGDPQPCQRKMTTGHRILARLKFKRPIDPSDKVYHTCGDPLCLNPDHIEIGTQADVSVMITKKRLSNR